MTDYKFVYFDDKDKEKEFVEKNSDKIVNIATRCFAPGDEFDRIKENDAFRGVVQRAGSQWFFVTSDDQIVAFCKLTPEEPMTRFNQSLKTYEPFVYEDIEEIKVEEHITTGPFIDALCKTAGYKGAGAFLLDNMHKHLKSKGVEKVYIVPESMRSKEAFAGYQEGLNCKLKDKYLESNQKLVKFYEKMGYEIIENTYFVEGCEDMGSESIAYNTMVCDLRKVVEGATDGDVNDVNDTPSDNNNRPHHLVRSRELRRIVRDMKSFQIYKNYAKGEKGMKRSIIHKLSREMSRESKIVPQKDAIFKLFTIDTDLFDLTSKKNKVMHHALNTYVLVIDKMVAHFGDNSICEKIREYYQKNAEFLTWSIAFGEINSTAGDIEHIGHKISKLTTKLDNGDEYVITFLSLAAGFYDKDNEYVIAFKNEDVEYENKIYNISSEFKKVPEFNSSDFGVYNYEKATYAPIVDTLYMELFYMMIAAYLMNFKCYLQFNTKDVDGSPIRMYGFGVDVQKK